MIARYGGEEFVVLARETDVKGATDLAERLRESVERARCPVGKQMLSVTVSIGVTISIGLVQFENPYTQNDLVAAADKALYQAKSGGRNKVVAIPVQPQRPAADDTPAAGRRNQ